MITYYPFSDGSRPGKIDEISASLDGTTIGLDYAGALVDEVALTGPVAATVSWVYQTGFLVASETVAAVGGPHTVNYTYDDDRMLTQAGDLVIGYDPGSEMNGLLADTTLDLITDTYAYNDFGELEHYQALFDGTDNLYEVFYERDKLGRVIRRAERVGTGTTVEVREYTYHLRGWLEEVLVGTVSSCTLTTCNCGDEVTCVVGEAYTYDDNGNRETASGSLIPDVVDGDTVYDVQDRQDEYGTATFEYDDRGQRELRTVGSDETQYVYSPYGELRQVTLPNATVIDYVFDPFGQRVGKKVGGNLEEAWVWGAELNPIAALDDGETFAARYVYGTRSWVPDYIDAGATNYRLITDQLGSVRVVVNTTTGEVQRTYQYDSFGTIIAETGTGYVQPFRFAGGFYDADTGLLRFGVRDYDPEVGRWTQKDPILFGGGDANLYAYVNNDPVNIIDPTGKWLLQAAGGVIGGAAQAYSNYGAYACGQISGAEYAASIAFGAFTGVVATLPTGVLGGAVAGGITSGANDAFNIGIGSKNASLPEFGRTVVYGAVTGGFANFIGKAGGQIVKPEGVVGQNLPLGPLKTHGTLGGAIGNGVGTGSSTLLGGSGDCECPR